MKAITIANKLVFALRTLFFSVLIVFPLQVRAEYYLAFGPPEVPEVCNFCEKPSYRPANKVHRDKHRYRHSAASTHKRTHYSLTVYYPVPTYVQTNPCTCCGGFIAPTYYWVPAPYRVYYTHPNDRLVGNSAGSEPYESSLDTGTADNDF